MSSETDKQLAQKRLQLRLQLQAQRKVIIQKFEQDELERNEYPRSMTMRFLRQQHVATLLTEFAALMFGKRVIKSVASMPMLAKIVKLVSFKKTKPQ